MGKIQNLMVGILLLSTIIIGANLFYASVGAEYKIEGMENISSFNKSTEMIELEKQVYGNYTNSSVAEGEQNIISTVTGLLGVFNLFFQAPDLLISMVNDMSGELAKTGIHINWFILILEGIIGIAVVLYVISAVQKWDM